MLRALCTSLAILAGTLLPQVLRAQYLSLETLIQLRGEDVEGVNALLSSKGWRFSDAAAESDNDYSVTTWSYGQRVYSERAAAFVNLYTAGGALNKLSYQTGNKQHYALLKGRIAANKMVKLASVVRNGRIATTYAGARYYVTVSVSTDDLTEMPVYVFTIARKTSDGAPGAELVATGATDDAAAEEDTGQEDATLAETAPGGEEPVDTDADFVYLADREDPVAPREQDVVGRDVTVEETPLYTRPWSSSPQQVLLEAGAPVLIISKLLNEDHSYYFVFAQGRFGYVRFSQLATNKEFR